VPTSRRSTGSQLRHAINKPRQQPGVSIPPQHAPLIPLDTAAGATQRLFAVGFYGALVAWKLYDVFCLHMEGDAASYPLFIKWALFDSIFIFGLPQFHIPWLEWTPGTMNALVILHFTMDAFMLLRIPTPFGWVLPSLWKLVWNRELAVSEASYRPDTVIDPSVLVSGRHVIKILPEGWVLFYIFPNI